MQLVYGKYLPMLRRSPIWSFCNETILLYVQYMYIMSPQQSYSSWEALVNGLYLQYNDLDRRSVCIHQTIYVFMWNTRNVLLAYTFTYRYSLHKFSYTILRCVPKKRVTTFLTISWTRTVRLHKDFWHTYYWDYRPSTGVFMFPPHLFIAAVVLL